VQDHSFVLALPVVAAQTFDFREASGSNLPVAAEQAHSSVALPVDWRTPGKKAGTMQ